MSKYTTYYNKAVDLCKAGNCNIPLSMVYGSDTYTKHEARILDKAIREVEGKAYQLAVKYHPTWLVALRSGASAAECFRAWKRDDPDGKYLNELQHIC